jgi:hypothetical protein
MRGLGIFRWMVLPLLTSLAVTSACGSGGDDSDDDGDDGPSGGGGTADAAPQIDAAPVGSCAGEPLACEEVAIGSFSCLAQAGCTPEGDCGASLFYCGGLSEATCTEVGCTWTSECQGAGLCFTQTSELACIQEPGCFWESLCDPLSDPANEHCVLVDDEATCTGDPVCEWAYQGCFGAPTPCSMLDEKACADQAGCSWQP